MSASASVLPMNIQGKFPLQDIPFSGFDHLAVQGTLKSLLYHNLKATIRQRAAFFMVQHPHTTTGKTIALTVQTFVGKVMSLFFNTLSRLSKLLFQGVSVFNFMAVVTLQSDFGVQERDLYHSKKHYQKKKKRCPDCSE